MESLLEDLPGETGGNARMEKERYALEVTCSRCGSIGTIISLIEQTQIGYEETGSAVYDIVGSIDIKETVKKHGWSYHENNPLCPVCANGLTSYLSGSV